MTTYTDLSAILIPQLVEEDFLTSAKSSEASWIASLSNLGQLAGSLATGVVSNTYGRKARKHYEKSLRISKSGYFLGFTILYVLILSLYVVL